MTAINNENFVIEPIPWRSEKLNDLKTSLIQSPPTSKGDVCVSLVLRVLQHLFDVTGIACGPCTALCILTQQPAP